MADEGIKTPQLLESERQEQNAHAVRISEATLEVEQVLLKHNLSWSDWGDVINTMNARSQMVFGSMTVKEINEHYGRRN